MVEYHGWAVIRVGLDALDVPVPGRSEEPKDVIAMLKSQIDQISGEHRILGLRAINGEWMLWGAGNTNHQGPDLQEILDLFFLIARIAAGSYGLLYIRDDEDPDANSNAFRVWKLARGVFVEMADPFLSPCVPTIE